MDVPTKEKRSIGTENEGFEEVHRLRRTKPQLGQRGLRVKEEIERERERENESEQVQ